MKKQLYFLLFVIVSVGSTGTVFLHITTNKSEINDAFIKGNGKLLSSFLNEMVEFNIEENEGTFSRIQAESILINFFFNNPPKTFEINQEGKTNDNADFVIATYTSVHGCKYRVYYKLKKQTNSGNDEQIMELNITKNKQCQSKI